METIQQAGAAPDSSIVRSHCRCGSVQFEISGPLRPIIYCHWSMCRRSSGHFVASTACAREDLHLKSEEGLRQT